MLGSFLAAVVIPALLAALYLWVFAKDQYASSVSFMVRSESQTSPSDMLGGLSMLSGATSTASDPEVLYNYFNSQDLVAKVDRKVDLRAIWSKPRFDPVFGFGKHGTIEDLSRYWNDMVRVTLDNRTNILSVRVLAFDPQDAKNITQAIFGEGTEIINKLSDIAREDAIRYAREDLNTATEDLRAARTAVNIFRNTNQIIDPSVDTMGQMGIVNTLQAQLATAMVEMDMLRQTTRDDDVRIQQAQRRIEVINQRISEERNKVGLSGTAEGGSASAFANLVGEYEKLSVDREFAEQTYTAALAAFNAARAEAGRQSRYLAAHVQPTLAEQSLFPQRGKIFILMTLFLILVWAVVVLVGYSLKDRK
ncbi:hypothetical protein [Falsirhodobacter sp. 1013]|uniref:hypothetical protein n=1 Tax=Falsirhodobacter sp. 1013 TaxID=3417566 RepID=UPI003EBF6B52